MDNEVLACEFDIKDGISFTFRFFFFRFLLEILLTLKIGVVFIIANCIILFEDFFDSFWMFFMLSVKTFSPVLFFPFKVR
jgi:hypothetical protein